MPRVQRIKGEFSTYHIIQRGNERKRIFRSDDDKYRFLETLAKIKDRYNFLVYAYCLMDNHIHLLINDNGNDISKIMKSLNVSYVIYFNRVYDRCGHLFQDRFKSELVIDDRYLLAVSRYIHNNPVKAKIVETPNTFKWSSYSIYSGETHDSIGLLDTVKILGCFSLNKKKAMSEYKKFVFQSGENEEYFLDIEEEYLSHEEGNHTYINGLSMAKAQIERILVNEKMGMEELLNNKPRRDELIRDIRRNSSLSLKELGKLVGGISESRISRIVNK